MQIFKKKLPQCEIFFQDENFFGEEILLVNGGRFPSRNFFAEIAKDKKIFAVDRGIELCRSANILPDVLIGDFDSAEKISVDWAAENKIPIIRHPVEKDFTDLQLALDFAEKNYKNFSAEICAAFGGRFDHLFSTIFTCANFNFKIFFADDDEIIFFLKGNEVSKVNFFKKPFALSLLPISEVCEGVTIKNVRWQLENAKLLQKFPFAVSNRLQGDDVKISLRAGILAVYFCFKE